ncbi:hypothetical protein ILUMI_03336 [Ignelater luminosus]|uniref:Uncharacterized protein n=1 Tax=Ignelater luminosus TaxID=2038154 RepID=A0A8K0DGQ5_IGNLU|nr:hypothetical protein ILUMI_03336 [Ignelater luminosus]
MQWEVPPKPLSGPPPMLQEVATWQAQHQIAYWKSRALAVEYENRMLHRILRETQIKQVEDYIENMKLQNEEYKGRPKRRVLGSKRNETEKNQNQERDFTHCGSKRPEKDETERKQYWAPPTDQEIRERQMRMTTLYGNMASKISGMETAVELNYELYKEKNNPQFWPNIPLRL